MVIGWPYIGKLRPRFGVILGAFGPSWAILAPFGPILASKGPFWPFLAVMWPPTGATQELGAQTHGDRVALHRGPVVLGLRPF